MIKRILTFSFLSYMSIILPANSTGHFPHERGKHGDWFWKDIQGLYSTHTNGPKAPHESFSVFCNDPDSHGGVAFSISVQGSQAGGKQLRLDFDNGQSVEVIASFSRVAASGVAGKKIIYSVLAQLRSASEVRVSQKGSPVAVFSLKGSTVALKRCP